MTTVIQPTPMQNSLPDAQRDKQLRDVAVKLEATFLSEMLSAAGLGKGRTVMNGGAGEDQFQSFLVQQQAERISSSGGIGLAEALFNALKEAEK